MELFIKFIKPSSKILTCEEKATTIVVSALYTETASGTHKRIPGKNSTNLHLCQNG